jgi:hypothetical protein
MTIDDAIDNADGTKTPVINHYSNEADYAVILRNVAPGVEDRDAANVGQLKTRLVAPLTASVGQYIKITAVDDGGKVAAVEAVDAPGGSGGGVHVGPDEPTDENVNVWIDLDDDETKVFVEAPATAEVGQTIVVKEVDETGKPTEWECANLPSVGGSVGWDFINSIELTEEATMVEITTDVNGDAFAYKELFIVVSAQAPTGKSDYFVWIPNSSWGTGETCNSLSKLPESYVSDCVAYATIMDFPDDTYYVHQWQPYRAYANSTMVVEISLSTNKPKWKSFTSYKWRGDFAVGSKFTLFGRNKV